MLSQSFFFLNQSNAVKMFAEGYYSLLSASARSHPFLSTLFCLYFLVDRFPNTPVKCHLSPLRSGMGWHCRESNIAGNRRSECPCVSMPWRHCVTQCNPVPYTFDSFPSTVTPVNNNNRAVIGGKNHSCMGKFTSDLSRMLVNLKIRLGRTKQKP